MDATTPIGLRIKRRRQVLGWRQEDLAERLGVAKSSVANWESGKHFPKRKLGLVEAVLGISLEEPEPRIPRSLLREIERTEDLTPGERAAVIAAIERTLRGEQADPPSGGAPGGPAADPAPERRRAAS